MFAMGQIKAGENACIHFKASPSQSKTHLPQLSLNAILAQGNYTRSAPLGFCLNRVCP
jgi:hypothetical protein